MRNIFRHSLIVALAVVAFVGTSCQREEVASSGVGGGVASGRQMTFTDEILTDTKIYVKKNAVEFDEGAQIKLHVDFSHINDPYRREYVGSIILTKQPAPSKIFHTDYSIVWLDDYLFDVYALYPGDVESREVEYPDEPYIQYLVTNVDYTTQVDYYHDNDSWYVATGATIYSDYASKTVASDPHDLITSMVLSRETAPQSKYITYETKYTDHGEDPVVFRFLHRLSRLEPYFVNGMGDLSEEVYLHGIAIYPTLLSASFGSRRHKWVNKRAQNLFEYSEARGGWLHYNGTSWDDDLVENTEWPTYFAAAPLKYVFNKGYKLNSTAAVMAEDEVVRGSETVNPKVEFRMLPESNIDCMILHFIVDGTDAFVPVRFKPEMNQGRDVLTQEGHTTRVVLSYKATMITLLYVQYIDDWDPLPGRYVVGDLQIE